MILNIINLKNYIKSNISLVDRIYDNILEEYNKNLLVIELYV